MSTPTMIQPEKTDFAEVLKFIQKNFDGYKEMRDGWKPETPQWYQYDLVVREYRKIIDALLPVFINSKPEEKQGWVSVKTEQSFESWLITNFKWNDAGWVSNDNEPCIVRDTAYLYDQYIHMTLLKPTTK